MSDNEDEDDQAIVDFVRQETVKNKTERFILRKMVRRFPRNFPDGKPMSRRSLTRLKKRHGIQKYDRSVTVQDVSAAVQRRSTDPTCHYGIRFMQLALREEGLLVSRSQVGDVMTLLNRPRPVNRVALERRMRYNPGSNFRWCMDGYDKLKHWGLYIHGATDEFSRMLIWCRCYSTNRFPEVVAKYYLDAVSSLGVVPQCTVSDFGHECNVIAECQYFFHRREFIPERHHRWTYSVMNVTIECFWRRLRAMGGQFWMDQLEKLKHNGDYDGTEADKWCIQAVYLPLINIDLERVCRHHNIHGIRKQANRLRPSGCPEDIYEMPEDYGGKQCGLEIANIEVRQAMLRSGLMNTDLDDPIPPLVRRVISDWMQENRVHLTIDNAAHVYLQLRQLVYANF